MDQAFDQVLAAAKLGEDWAWTKIYTDLAGPLTGYLTLRGASDPEDETSETLLSVARNIASFEGDEEAFRSWVFVIAHRRMIDARRKRSRRVETTPLEAAQPRGGDVEVEALSALSAGEVMEMLAPLTDEQREVIVLRVLADLSLEQTANVVGKRIGSVKALQRRAIATLRRHLTETTVSK